MRAHALQVASHTPANQHVAAGSQEMQHEGKKTATENMYFSHARLKHFFKSGWDLVGDS